MHRSRRIHCDHCIAPWLKEINYYHSVIFRQVRLKIGVFALNPHHILNPKRKCKMAAKGKREN